MYIERNYTTCKCGLHSAHSSNNGFYVADIKYCISAKSLSARLLILQSVFSVCGVWPQLPSCFRNAISQLKVWIVRKIPFPFRNAIKSSCLQKMCTLMQVCCSQLCSGTSSLIAVTSRWPKTRARKKELGDWHKNGDRETKGSHWSPRHGWMSTWLTVTKALAMPTNSNAHVSPVGSSSWETHEAYTVNMYT